MTWKFTNHAVSKVENITANSLTVSSGDGNQHFPNLADGDIFHVAVEDRYSGTFEICKVTARVGDAFTVLRGQEGTSQTGKVGDIVALRATAEFYNEAAVSTASLEDILTRLEAAEAAIENGKIKVGDLYLSADAENPAYKLGYGAWERHANGRALVGVGDNGTSNWGIGRQTGVEAFKLETGHLPSHNHGMPNHTFYTNYTGNSTTRFTLSANEDSDTVVSTGGSFSKTSDGSDSRYMKTDAGSKTRQRVTLNWYHRHSFNLNGVNSKTNGSGWSHNNIQPSIAVYVWKRTA